MREMTWLPSFPSVFPREAGTSKELKVTNVYNSQRAVKVFVHPMDSTKTLSQMRFEDSPSLLSPEEDSSSLQNGRIQLLDLPIEILVRISSFLREEDLFAVSQV